MADEKKFYRTVITVEVLSEEPFDFDNLSDVHDAITDGACSGDYNVTTQEEVDGPTMAKLLEAQGSDPAFFMLTEDGEDANEDDPEYVVIHSPSGEEVMGGFDTEATAQTWLKENIAGLLEPADISEYAIEKVEYDDE